MIDAYFLNYELEHTYMKKVIKNALPNRLVPIVQRLYWKVSNKVDLSKEYDLLKDLEILKCKISYNKYGGYCVPLSSHHRPAAQKVLTNDIHEPQTIEYILNNCKNGDVVHAGTYFGDFLPALSKGVVAGAKIWAFEPNPENYRCAKVTLEINDIKNTVLINAGLGEKPETLLIKTMGVEGLALGGASRITSEKTNDIGMKSVQIVTVDDVVGSNRIVSIIQLDVEGYEKKALTGALKTIRRCLPIIILEVLPDSTLVDSDWFFDNIISLGYKKNHDVHGNSIFSFSPKK